MKGLLCRQRIEQNRYDMARSLYLSYDMKMGKARWAAIQSSHPVHQKQDRHALARM